MNIKDIEKKGFEAFCEFFAFMERKHPNLLKQLLDEYGESLE